MKEIILFQANFEVTDIDPHGKKFDRVSRIIGTCPTSELIIDINTEIYKIDIGEQLLMLLTNTIYDQKVDPKQKEQFKPIENSLADEYEYCMYGKCYKFDDSKEGKVSVYCSFGGLLLSLVGDYRQLMNIQVGQYLYLLIRKTN